MQCNFGEGVRGARKVEEHWLLCQAAADITGTEPVTWTAVVATTHASLLSLLSSNRSPSGKQTV